MTKQRDPDERGVVYLSRIPHGFYEPQMKHFFEQFGHVTRLKLWRSKKSGKSQGFAYVEFEYEDVAKIVSETMDNYLMYQKLLKCKFIPNEELKPNAFTNAHRRFIKPYHREASARRHNRLLTASREHILENQRRLVHKEKKRRKKMEALGIQCNLPGYVDEWKNIKKAYAIISEKERLEALRQKEVEMRKQEAVKRAKDKVKARSKKRRIAIRRSYKAEKEKTKAGQQDSVQKSSGDEELAESEKLSPKRKCSELQDSAVSSTKEASNQSHKKKTKLGKGTSSPPKVALASEGKEGKSPTNVEPSKKITRMSLRSQDKPRKSLEVGLKPLEKTPSKNSTVTPKSIIKRSVKKTASSSKPTCTPKTPAPEKKRSPEVSRPDAPSQSCPTNRKAKTPRKEPASDEFETSTDYGTSDSTEEEPKIPKFTGITLAKSESRRESLPKRNKKHPKIRIHGDELVTF